MSAWEKELATALRAYRELHVNLLVPQRFVVPSGDERWPTTTWGYKLGRAVNTLRTKLENKTPVSAEMKEELDELGFAVNVTHFKWDHIILPGLRQYWKMHGHVDVPQDFVVPAGDEAWPKVGWGYRLGQAVVSIRYQQSFSSQVAESTEELGRMGLCFDKSIYDRDWEEKILPSLQVFRREFGHCAIPWSFVVPSSSPWPERAWGMELGKIVVQIRLGAYYVKQAGRDKDALDAVGFVWDRTQEVWNEIIMPALEVYAEINKNGRMSQTFVIPSEDPWPQRAWGRRPGMTITQVRCKGYYFTHYGRDIAKLDELGVNVKLMPRVWNERVVPLLEMFAELCGDDEVPAEFVIPSEAPWDEEMWGVQLGLIVARNSHLLRHE